MKRAIMFYTASLLVLIATGCDRTILEFPEGQSVDPTLVQMNLRLDVDPSIELYSSRTTAGLEEPHQVRWIVEVFRDEIAGDPVERRILTCDKSGDGRHSIQTPLTLNAAKYHIVAWADYVDKGSVEDKYYTVNSLASILLPDPEDYIGDEEDKDTFVGHKQIDLTGYRYRWNETVDCPITLERPMAKIEFITTDIAKFIYKLSTYNTQSNDPIAENLLSNTPDLQSIRVTVEYDCYFPSSFNAYTNKPNDARLGMSFNCNMSPTNDNEAHLAGDHIFVNGAESAVTVNLTLSDSEGNTLNRIEGINVPIVRGKLTVIRDEFLTKEYAPGIGIDTEFDGEINVVIPD